MAHKQEHTFSKKKVSYYFDTPFSELENIVSKVNTVIITDEIIFEKQSNCFTGWKTIVIASGEVHKQQKTVDEIIAQLILLEADRSITLIGVGGGVITDITGYVASIYLRGVAFAFVPTTILAMVDAAIGGKNGVDVGAYKNLVGTINQPHFILYDYSLLTTLPHQHWVNGFAEIIKHACIKDAVLFEILEQKTIQDFQKNKELLASLIEKNVAIKTEIVLNDEFETGDRKLLNFGHTLGHAIENTYHLLHGQAVSVGMLMACNFSHKLNGLNELDVERIKNLVKKYELSTSKEFEKNKIWQYMLMDKKRKKDELNFILLNKIGEASIQKININKIEKLTEEYLQAK